MDCDDVEAIKQIAYFWVRVSHAGKKELVTSRLTHDTPNFWQSACDEEKRDAILQVIERWNTDASIVQALVSANAWRQMIGQEPNFFV